MKLLCLGEGSRFSAPEVGGLDLCVVLLGEDSTNWVAESQKVDLCRKDCCGFVWKSVLNRSRDSKTPSNSSILLMVGFGLRP